MLLLEISSVPGILITSKTNPLKNTKQFNKNTFEFEIVKTSSRLKNMQ